jgi:hypothetical protein
VLIIRLKLKNPESYKKKFSQEVLVKKYQDFAKRDATRFANSAIGQPISSVAVQKLTNAGSIPSLVGTIFESAIDSIIKDPEYLNAFKLGGQNSLFDFINAGEVNDFFGIPKSVKYVEAKYRASNDALKSFGSKIYKQEMFSNSTAGVLQEKQMGMLSDLRPKWIQYKTLPGRTKGNTENQALFRQIVSGLNLDPTTPRATLVGRIDQILKTASGGYIPNFAAAALQQAIAREKSAGLSNSQIYIDQNPSLKSNMNPMGLMVANTRDEPMGGFQGVARARQEGANPKTYGASNGFVPNYAIQAPIGQVSAVAGVLKQDKVDAFNKALEDTAKQLKREQISLSQAEQNIEVYAKTVGTSIKGQNILITEGKKLIQAYDAEYQARKQKAEELKKQRASDKNQPVPPNIDKGFADTAGKIFLLQSALSFLQGAVGDTENSFAKITTAFANASGNITSLALLGKEIQGIKIDGSGLAAGFGRFAKGLGIAGVAFGVITEGFKFADFALKEFSGENQRAALASAKLADASDKLSVKFESLSQTRQAEISTQASKILGSAGYEGFFNGIANIFRSEKLGGGNIGDNPQVKRQTSQLLALGASAEQVTKILEDSRKYTDGVDETGATYNIEITKLENILNGLETSLSTGLGKTLSDQYKKFDTELSKTDFQTPEESKKKAAEIYGQQSFEQLPKGVQMLLNERIKQQDELNKAKRDEIDIDRDKALGERLSIDLAKQKLDNLLEQKKAQIDINTYSSTENLRFQLDALDLSEKYKNSLQEQIKLKEIDAELSKKNLDIVKSAIDKITSLPSGSSLSINEEQFNYLRSSLKKQNIQTPEELQTAIQSVGGRLGLTSSQTASIEKFYTNEADQAKTSADQQKTQLRLATEYNDKLIDTKNILESMSAVRKRELEYQAKHTEQLKGKTPEQAISIKQSQVLEQRSMGRGLEKGFDTIQDRINGYKVTLGEEIPNLFSQNLAQGLNDAISGAKDLKSALTDAATSFFQAITQKNISNLADLVTSGFGGFFGAQNKATGGIIKGGSGIKDDVPAMLMGGEYVINKSAVSKYGKGFLDALNNGRMRGYATGGIVDPQTYPTQTGKGGFSVPGDYGQGAITGKNDLLTFASQTYTSGQYDYMGGFGMNGATVSLEAESARLSASGRENSPMFERVQQSKDEAFRVYLEGLQKEKEYANLLDQIAKDKKARKKQLQAAIISAAVSSAASYAGNAFATGARNATSSSLAAGGKGGFLTSAKGGFSNLENIFSPSNALKLSSDAKFFKDIGFNGDISKLSNENALKLFQNYPKFGTSYNYTNGVYRATGGLISGGSNIRDDVPAMLTGGEFVLNNRATQRIGLQNLSKLNNGQPVSGEGASADLTQALISKLDELIQATQNSSDSNVVVNVSTNDAGQQTQNDSSGTEKELGKKIRQAVLDVIAQEKRLGGSLEKAR